MPAESNVRGRGDLEAEEDISPSASAGDTTATAPTSSASDFKWRHTREESEDITDAPTPSPAPTPASASTPGPVSATSPSPASQGSLAHQRHQGSSAPQFHTLAARLPGRTTDMSRDSSVGSSPAGAASTSRGSPWGRRGDESASSPNGHGTPPTKLSGIGRKMNDLSINAEDEDVQIAIAALGSMKNIDSSRSGSVSSASAPSQPHSRATTYETAGMMGGGAGSEGEDAQMDADTGRATTSSYPHHYTTDAASSSGRSSSFADLLHTGGAPSSASSTTSTATHYTTTQASTASGAAGGGRGAHQTPQGHHPHHHHQASSLQNRKKGKGKDVASSSYFPDNSDDSVRSGSGSASASASIMGSTASAIIHDEDGNPIRIELDSSDAKLLRGDDGDAISDAEAAERRAALEGEVDEEAFLQRFGRLPIVRGTLRAYELGKRHSRVVKYGAGLVESGVKSISRPVISRVGDALGESGVQQLDGFARRQLDRIYPGAPTSPIIERFSPTKEEKAEMLAEIEERERTEWQHMDDEEKVKRRRAYWALKLEEKEREVVVQTLREKQQQQQQMAMQPSASPSADLLSPEAESLAVGRRIGFSDQQQFSRSASEQGAAYDAGRLLAQQHGDTIVAGAQQQQQGRSGWSGMLVEAGVTAGGLSAAMSEESLKSLKYCLQWLQYATAQIEHQITQLRDLIVKLNHGELDLAGAVPGQHLAHIKGDVVNTIRGVVDVVGKYAGGALPAGARSKVKEFILSLPARWATVNRTTSVGPSNSPYFGGSPASPSFSPLHATGGSPTSDLVTRTRNPQAAHAAAAANKVLTLAVESLDIIRSVTVVFGESLDRADTWMERLRYLGLQRKRQHDAAVGRIEMGAAGDWERAGAVQRARAHSIDAFSDISMASGSSKRRKTRARGGKRSGSRAAATPDSASEDGNNTETERHGESSGYHSPEVYMSRSNSHAENSASFVPGSAAGAPVAGSSTAFFHGAGTSAHRRKTRAKPSNRSRPPSVPGTPNYPANSLHGD